MGPAFATARRHPRLSTGLIVSVLEHIGLTALRKIDPEAAHGLALRALRAGLAPMPGPVISQRLQTTVAALFVVDP